jgi:hypothetical protein
MKLFFTVLIGLLAVCFFLSCDGGGGVGGGGGGGGGGDGNNIPSTASYTYAYKGYVMTITSEANQKALSVSMKSIYPGGDYMTSGRAVLAGGETAKYTLTYDGVVKSSGKVLMGTDGNATFTPASGKPGFTGKLISETELNIPDSITLDDGSTLELPPMKKTGSQEEAAFAEYWGVWQATISGYPVTLTVGDGVWELWISGRFDSSGTYEQTSSTTADIIRNIPAPVIKTGYVKTGAKGSMTIVLTDGAYRGTYSLRRE